MSGLNPEERAKNLREAIDYVNSFKGLDKKTKPQLNWIERLKSSKKLKGEALLKFERDIMNAHSQHIRRLNMPEAEKVETSKKRLKYLRDNPEQHYRSTKKTGVINSLEGNLINSLDELGSSEDVKLAKALNNKLSKRGYTITDDDLKLHKRLLDKELSIKSDIRHINAAKEGKRLGNYNLTDSELKEVPELYEFDRRKKSFNEHLNKLKKDLIIDDAQYKKYKIAPGHALNVNSFPEFASDLANIRAEISAKNHAANIKLTPAQIWDAAKRRVSDGGVGITSDARYKMNEFGKWAESKDINLDGGSKRFGKGYTLRNALGYITGYGSGGHGLPGIRNVPTKGRPTVPEGLRNQYTTAEAIAQQKGKQRDIYNKSIINLWKSNPKKAAIATALLPASLLYSTVSSSDDVPIESLDRQRGERFLGTRRADNVWQSAKHNVLKEGGWLDWFSLLDYTDLGFYGKGQRKYNMNLKNAEERKMVDPTWRGTGLLETQGDKITTLDRQRRKRENIWT